MIQKERKASITGRMKSPRDWAFGESRRDDQRTYLSLGNGNLLMKSLEMRGLVGSGVQWCMGKASGASSSILQVQREKGSETQWGIQMHGAGVFQRF